MSILPHPLAPALGQEIPVITEADRPAAPVARYAMGRWLGGVAYRVELNLLITAIAAAGALAAALATVGLQGLRSAAASPAISLRNE